MYSLKKTTLYLLLIFSYFSISAQDFIEILPMGNSLTYGYMNETEGDGNRVGYRNKLYQLLLAAGYNFDFVGHASTGYNIIPASYSQTGGIPGIRDHQLATIMASGYYYNSSNAKVDIVYPNAGYLTKYPADIVLIEIGTNDVINDDIYNLAKVGDILDAIHNYEVNSGKQVLTIIANVMGNRNLTDGLCSGVNANWRVSYYNDNLTTIVNTKISAGYRIKLVDLQCGAGIIYNNTDMYDDVHPKQTGYDKMGAYWYQKINEINSAPVLQSLSPSSINEGSSFIINLDSYVSDDFSADTDIDWEVVPTPTKYNVSINGSRIATVTPKTTDWYGTENITFKATDKCSQLTKLRKSNSMTGVFTVNGVNDTPVITSQKTTFNIQEDGSFNLALSDVNANDPDGDALTLIIKAGSNYSINGSTITPTLNFNGTLFVNVTVKDIFNAESAVFQVVASISAVNDAPSIINHQTITMLEDNSLQILKSYLTIVDPDNISSELTLNIIAGTNYTKTGTTIKPSANFNGVLTVNVTVSDLQYQSNIYSLPVTVNAVNDRPVIYPPVDLTAFEDIIYQSTITVSDIDNSNLTISAQQIPSWLILNSVNKTLTGTANFTNIGDNVVSLRVSDGLLFKDTTFTIVVLPTNHSPEITSEPLTEGIDLEEYSYVVEATDPDNDNLTFMAFKLPAFLSFNALTNTVRGTPKKDDIGDYLIELGVYDGQLWDTQSYNLSIVFHNKPPEISSIPEDSIDVGKIYLYGVEATDPDEDELLLFEVSIPEFLIFQNFSGVLIGTPNTEQQGDYDVIIGATDGIDTTLQAYTLIVHGLTGMPSISLKNQDDYILVYPKPASQFINVEISDELTFQSIRVFNEMGQILIMVKDELFTLNSNEYQLNIEKLVPGPYWIEILTNASVITDKIIVY